MMQSPELTSLSRFGGGDHEAAIERPTDTEWSRLTKARADAKAHKHRAPEPCRVAKASDAGEIRRGTTTAPLRQARTQNASPCNELRRGWPPSATRNTV
jgi:hypothetical protein